MVVRPLCFHYIVYSRDNLDLVLIWCLGANFGRPLKQSVLGSSEGWARLVLFALLSANQLCLVHSVVWLECQAPRATSVHP